LLGWWGLPFGALVTPVQLIRNVLDLLRPGVQAPSKELRRVVCAQRAKQFAAAPYAPG
jgi:hypothetical protein